MTDEELYLTPQNGAAIAVGSKRDFFGCSAAGYSSERVPFAAVPVSTFICARTAEGRVASFRIDAVWGVPRTLSINFATWE